MAQYNTANGEFFGGHNTLHEVVMVAYSNGSIVDNFSAGYTGSASTVIGYTGSLGYTGSVGVGYTGSIGTQGYTGSQGTTAGFTGSIPAGANTLYFVNGLATVRT